jgi:DNA repair exonuclease SbcCD nuclease subunit
VNRLIFSDLHLHPYAYGATVTDGGFNSRLWAQWEAAEEMINDAEANDVKYAYCCGDLFHLHGMVPSQAQMVASAILDELRRRDIKVRILPGNHDQGNRTGSIHSLSWLPQEERSGRWEDGGLLVRGLPYTASEDVLKRFLEYAGEDGEGMVLLHQGVSGVPLSSGWLLDEKLDPNMIPDNVKAFTGHYHFHKVVTVNLTVVGNLAPINWGDIDQPKGWIIWDDETDMMRHRIQSRAPDFRTWSKAQAKHSCISNNQNSFVRYTDTVSLKQQEKIREELLEAGARRVEFPSVKTKKKKIVQSGDDITMAHILKGLADRDSGRRAEVGIEIREETYSAPDA